MAEEEHEHPHPVEGAEHAGSKLMEILSHHVGPWPLWVWLGAGGAGLIIAAMIKKNGGLGVASPVSAPTPGAGSGSSSGGGGTGSDSGTVAPTGGDSVQGLDNLVHGVNLQSQIPMLQLAPLPIPNPNRFMTSVLQVGGNTVQVPSAVVANSNRSESTLAASGYSPSGGFSNSNYIAGEAPADVSHPAGGGVYAGLTDTQTASLFQSTYGNNWQPVWEAQHAQEVAQNGQ